MLLELKSEAVNTLLKFLKIDTSRGNTEKIIDSIKSILERHDVHDIEIVEDKGGHSNLIAEIKGDKPVINFVSHCDTVPVGPKDLWKHDPYGEVYEGKIYGRGAFDNKGQLVSQLFSFIQLKRLGVKGLKLTVFSDEEKQLSNTGARWLIRNHWDLLKCDYALGEGGLTIEILNKKILLVSFGERGGAEYFVKTRGSGGHTSLKGMNSTILHKAIVKLLSPPLGIKSKKSQKAIREMQRNFPFNRLIRTMIFMSKTFRELFKALKTVQFNVSQIELGGNGENLNMAPTTLRFAVNLRLVPMTTEDEADRILESLLNRKIGESEFEIRKVMFVPSKFSPLNTEFYLYLKDKVSEYGFHSVAPYILPASTDLAWFRERGVPSYGFFPSSVATVEMAKRSHSVNEYVSIEALESSIDLTVRMISDFKGGG